MPYVKSQERAVLDQEIDKLIQTISLRVDRDGDVNYVISRVVAGVFGNGGWSYKLALRAWGTFGMAADEFRRRIVVPYEKRKIEENGDIREYEEVTRAR